MVIYLEDKTHKESRRHKLRVVGWISDRFFLTTCAYENGVRVRLREGKDYNIRYLSGGKIYGFKTTFYRVIPTPTPLLLFAFPQVVECIELRKEPRFVTFFTADIGSKRGEIWETYKGTVVNLSKSGCCIKLNQNTNWEVGQGVNITFEMPTDNVQYQLKGIVRTIRKSKDIESIGVEFQDPPEAFKKQVDIVATVSQEAP